MASADLNAPLLPGEPLTEKIDTHNQKLLEDDVARRLELSGAVLTKRQLSKAERKLRDLHWQLKRAKYNQLVTQYSATLNRYERCKAVYGKNPTDRLKREIIRLHDLGKKIGTKLQKLQPLHDEFQRLTLRMEAHEQAIALEQEEKANREAFYREATIWEQQIQGVFRSSPRLHSIKKDNRGYEVMDIPRIEKVILTPDRIYFQIETAYQTFIDRMVNRWQYGLPYGVDIADLVKDETIQNLSAACRRVVTVERGETSQTLFYVVHRLDSADGIPKSIQLAQIIDFYPKERHQDTPWAAGIGTDRKITHFDFEQHPHVLIAGSSGGGKSNLINAILSQLITMNDPDELRLLLIDNKGGIELSHFDNIPHLLVPPVISINEVIPALKFARAILTQRLAMMQEIKAKNLIGYNKMVKNPLSRLVIVVDEMATLIGTEDTPTIHNDLRVLTSQGRAVGIHLIVCTQHPTTDTLPGYIKTNLTLRIASKMPHHTASQLIVDSITAAHLPEVPGRMVFRRGGFEMILQTPRCDDDAIAKAVKIARNYPEAEWQVGSDDPDSSAVIEPPKPLFGETEYLRAAVALDGSLSPRKIYDNYSKHYMSQAAALEFGNQLVERLSTQQAVCIDGVLYEIERLQRKRGYRLKRSLEQPTETPAENNEITRDQEEGELEHD